MSDDELNLNLFSIKLCAFVKSFSSQKSDTPVNGEEPWIVEVDNLRDFKRALWPKVVGYLKREIFFIDKTPCWSDRETPVEEDLDKFVTLFDNKSRRFIDLNGITSKDLQRWSDDRLLNLHICQYSHAVSNKALWTAVEKKLLEPAERDRSGAAAESAIATVVEQLKEEHRLHYRAAYICWRQWADFIFKQPAHLRGRLIHDPPPQHLIHLFARTHSDTDMLVNELRQNLSIGEGINSGITLDVVSLRNAFDPMKICVFELYKATKDFEVRLTALEHKCQNNNETLSLFQEAVGPVENEFGKEMYSNIGEQDDVDHL